MFPALPRGPGAAVPCCTPYLYPTGTSCCTPVPRAHPRSRALLRPVQTPAQAAGAGGMSTSPGKQGAHRERVSQVFKGTFQEVFCGSAVLLHLVPRCSCPRQALCRASSPCCSSECWPCLTSSCVRLQTEASVGSLLQNWSKIFENLPAPARQALEVSAGSCFALFCFPCCVVPSQLWQGVLSCSCAAAMESSLLLGGKHRDQYRAHRRHGSSVI